MTKSTWIGCALVVAAAWCWNETAQSAYTSDPVAPFGGGELVTHFEDNPTGPTALTVIEPHAKVVAVYHIHPETGEISLKSVRQFGWDLRLVEFNGGAPTPDEIRNGLERQQ
jgi:hypothetical protein